jgi:hypothetical protein
MGKPRSNKSRTSNSNAYTGSEFFNSVGNFSRIAAKINTENPIGMPTNVWPDNMPIGTGAHEVPYNVYYDYQPGIMVSNFIPGPGPSYDAHSAVNIAGHAEMAIIRSYNSGAINNYDQASLVILSTVVDSAYMWHALLMRMYGTIRKFHAMNRYMPQALVEAQGFNYAEMESEQQRLVFLINRLAYSLNTIYLPKMPIFDRHRWLCSKVFREGNSEKTQLYIPKPYGLYFLDEFNLSKDPGSARAKFCPWTSMHGGDTPTSYQLTIKNVEDITDRMINQLLQSSAVAIISGDVKKAYGENVLKAPEIDDNYTVDIDYDVSYLHCVHNATAFPATLIDIPAGVIDVYENLDQDTGAMYVAWDPLKQVESKLLQDRYFTQQLYTGKRLIDFKVDEPDNDLIRQGTAWTVTNRGTQWHFGTEICVDHQIWMYQPYSALNPQPVAVHADVPYVSTTNSNLLAQLAKFYMAPILHVITTQGEREVEQITFHEIHGEIENYTVISDTEVYKLHEANLLEGWAVPQVKY